MALFLFFFRILPYHLFHREQTQLFLLATEPLAGYLRHPAALARLSGDFLTQFFYYEGGGPTIMAVVLFYRQGIMGDRELNFDRILRKRQKFIEKTQREGK